MANGSLGCFARLPRGILGHSVNSIPPGRSSEVAKAKRDSREEVFRVLPRQVDQTLSAALREWLPGKSWSEVRRLLKSRRVMVSGNLCVDAGYRLRLIDVVKLLPHPVAPPAREEDVRIRYLDKHVVVVEKPAGMTSTRHADERTTVAAPAATSAHARTNCCHG